MSELQFNGLILKGSALKPDAIIDGRNIITPNMTHHNIILLDMVATPVVHSSIIVGEMNEVSIIRDIADEPPCVTAIPEPD